MLKSAVLKVTTNIQRTVWSVLLLAPLMAFAETGDGSTSMLFGNSIPNVIDMLKNLIASFPALMFLTGALSYLFGGFLMVRSLWEIRKYGEGISMVAQRDLRSSLIGFCIGTALIFVPSTIRTLLATVYGTDAITGYAPVGENTIGWHLMGDTLIVFMQFIGYVAVVRGLLHLHHASSGQSQQNGFAKGIVHLIGGVLSINIMATKDMLYSTFGLMT